MTKLRGGVTLVSPEERKAVEGMYVDPVSQWRRRKRMFKDVWDAITENSPKDIKEFKVLISFCHICSFPWPCKFYFLMCVHVNRRNSVLNTMKMLA